MTIEMLMRQPVFPFLRFLDDRDQYMLSRDFWQQSFNDALSESYSRNDWTTWMNNPFCDGLPIWSAINRKAWRGISVQQVRRTDDPIWFKCWVSESNFDETRVLPYLFVETFVSESSYEFFVEAVKLLVDEKVSILNISKKIEALQMAATSIGAPPP